MLPNGPHRSVSRPLYFAAQARVEHVGKISICHLVPPSGVQSLQGLQGTSRVHFIPNKQMNKVDIPDALLLGNPSSQGGCFIHPWALLTQQLRQTMNGRGQVRDSSPGRGIFNFKVAT